MEVTCGSQYLLDLSDGLFPEVLEVSGTVLVGLMLSNRAVAFVLALLFVTFSLLLVGGGGRVLQGTISILYKGLQWK
jgi:hypothetical protein